MSEKLSTYSLENLGSDFEETKKLIQEVGNLLDQERERGRGRLADTISETESSKNGVEYFVDGGVVYIPRAERGIFVGDLHGDSQAVDAIIKHSKFEKRMEKDKDDYLVFIGDYADRGSDDIKTLEKVLGLKMKYPDNVVLLRGNHEESELGKRYGFLDSLFYKYPKGEALELFEKYNQLFEKMPGVVVTACGIIVVHGGIPNQPIESLKDLNNEETLEHMRWNDPSEEIEEFKSSMRGGPTKKFGQKPFKKFMRAIEANIMLRGHEAVKQGKKILFNEELATIFSTGRGVGNYNERQSTSGYWDKVTMPKYAEIELGQDVKKINPLMFKDIIYKN